MGLPEAIPEEGILALAGPDDADGDGISGRANYVWDVGNGKLGLGRFGWEASQPTVEQQAAGAFPGDIGITSRLFPDENCPEVQSARSQAPNGGEPELTEDRPEKVTIHTQTLAVPAMRNTEDEQVKQGARLFVQSQCSACHTPRYETGDTHSLEPLRGQVIYPYTNLLLQDMGKAWPTTAPTGLPRGRSGEGEYLTPGQAERMASQPDLILAAAHLIRDTCAAQGYGRVQVRADAYVSYNGRLAARLIGPTADLVTIQPGGGPKPWITLDLNNGRTKNAGIIARTPGTLKWRSRPAG